MEMKRVLIGIVILAVIAGGGYAFMRTSTNDPQSSYVPVIVPENEIPPETVTFYSASDEEAKVTFTGVDATIEYAPLGTVTLREIESGSGGLYTNDTETITLWDRGDKVTVWEGDVMLFEGYGEKIVEDTDDLTGKTWVWASSEKSDGSRFVPKMTGAFTIAFDSGKIQGKTDCNSFFGGYTRDADMIAFDSLGSTKMYCEGSEESTFTDALMQVDRYRVDETGTLFLFLKNEAGVLTLQAL